MNQFECHLNRCFWRSKRVVKVVQIGGRGWAKSKRTAACFREAFPYSDLQQLEWEAPVFSTLKAKSPGLAGRLPSRRCFEGIIFLQSHLVKLRLISPVTPFPTLNVSSPVLTISCTGISIDPLKLLGLVVQDGQITQMHGNCTSSKP